MLTSRYAAAMAVGVALAVAADPSPAKAITCQDAFRINAEAMEGFSASLNEAATLVGALTIELADTTASDETLSRLVEAAGALKVRSDQAMDFAERQLVIRDHLC